MSIIQAPGIPSRGSCVPTAAVSAATCCVASSVAPLSVSACASRSLCSRCCAWARSASSPMRMRASCQRSSACTQRKRLAGQRGEQQLAQRRDHPLPGRHVVARGRDAGQAGGRASRRTDPRRRRAARPRRRRAAADPSPRAAPCRRRAPRARSAAQLLAVLGQQAVERRLGHGDRTGAAGPGQAREAAARLPHHQLGRGGRRERDLPPFELRQHEIERRLPLLVERLSDGGQRWRREARVLDVVEADHRDVGRGPADPRSSSARDRAQRHVVVAGDEGVELHLALVDQELDGRLAASPSRSSPRRRGLDRSGVPRSASTAR